MSKLLNNVLKLLVGQDVNVDVKVPDFLTIPTKRPLKNYTDRELLKFESQIGAELFGPIPKDGHREFFCLDAHTWIWHEEWIDEDRRRQVATTRYEIQHSGVLKIQEGARYSYLDGEELRHLIAATKLYYERVLREVYHRDPVTGNKLASQLV